MTILTIKKIIHTQLLRIYTRCLALWRPYDVNFPYSSLVLYCMLYASTNLCPWEITHIIEKRLTVMVKNTCMYCVSRTIMVLCCYLISLDCLTQIWLCYIVNLYCVSIYLYEYHARVPRPIIGGTMVLPIWECRKDTRKYLLSFLATIQNGGLLRRFSEDLTAKPFYHNKSIR